MARSPKTWLLMVNWLILGLAAGISAWIWARGYAMDAMPLGIPLPDVAPIYTIIERDAINDTSLVEHRMPEILLESLAAQPDGLPPLKYRIECEMGDFTISHPYASETISFPYEQVKEDNVLIQAELRYDQPLKALKYSAEPRLEGETILEFTERLRNTLAESGAEFYEDTTPYIVDGYRFEHFEYQRQFDENGGDLSHFMYIGTFGPYRALVLNFMTSPERHELARPGVLKILGSFVPGWDLLERDSSERGESAEAGEDQEADTGDDSAGVGDTPAGEA